jgi:hypothetical protein
MKVKVQIQKGQGWYKDRVGDTIPVCFSKKTNSNGMPCFVAKTWNWYWNRDVIDLIDPFHCIVVDETGSDFEDGLELGKVLGAEEKRKEFIAEGFITDDEEEEEE